MNLFSPSTCKSRDYYKRTIEINTSFIKQNIILPNAFEILTKSIMKWELYCI